MDSRHQNPAAGGTNHPTQMLEDEHVLIETVIAALATMVRRSRETGNLEIEDAREAVGFFRDFADGAHHEKEEQYLFPAMEKAGLPASAGPTSVMREEHERGRTHIRAMSAALDASPPDLAAFQQHASSFGMLLRDHIAKENQVLFPMAAQLLDPAAQGELALAFAAQDPAIRTRFAAIAAKLSETYAQ